jgi:hypothetical protein
MKQEHQKWHVSSYYTGANTADEKEIVGSQAMTGEFIEGRNARIGSSEGNNKTSEKIKGEELLYPATSVGNYTCMGSIGVNGKLFSVWASPVGGQDPYFEIDGLKVCQSSSLDINVNYPIQLDKNENSLGGEVFITDNRVEPTFYNIDDLYNSVFGDPTKYFSAFNPKLYSINLYVAMNIPVYVGIANVGGGGGLPVGTYSYQLRYSSNQGDKTNISQRTPLIPIFENMSDSSAQYPGTKTYGDEANTESNTRYGIRIRFRITNLAGYDYVEVIRTAYNTNGGIGFVPAPTVVAKIDIFDGEISVRDFVDPVESNVNTVLSDAEVTRELSFVEKAKSLRYFDKRLELMNVKLASKASNLVFNQLGGKEMFPVIDSIGTKGYKDPYNFVYRKKYTNGERFGFAVNLWDGVGGKGFAEKVTNFENYKFPNRRDVVSAETSLYSYGNTVTTTDVNNNLSETHEVFDHFSAISKTDKCSFKNIYHNKTLSAVFGTKIDGAPGGVNSICSETPGEIIAHGASMFPGPVVGGTVSPYYHPYTPTSQVDQDVESHNYVVNTQVAKTYTYLVGSVNPPAGTREDYSPKIFAPEYYAMGIGLAGVSNFPSWAKSFSVVRTPPAKRVIAQGIAMYKMSQADFRMGFNNKLTTKSLDEFLFFSPDIENGIVSGSIINDIIESPGGYSLQFVSPLGFASEVYSFEANEFAAPGLEIKDRCIDMISYARMQRDIVGPTGCEINPMEDPGMGYNFGAYNYVGYAKWRNRGQQPTTFTGPNAGNTEFGILSAERIIEGRGSYMSIRMANNLYGAGSVGGVFAADFDDAGMQDWTEPFYIVNIISSGAQIPDRNIENYQITDHYQKLESIIGEGNGLSTQKFILVDERWEDVIPALSSSHPTATTERYIYIKRYGSNIEEKWVNVTFKTAPQLAAILNDIATLGAYAGDITGVYTHEDIEGNGRFFNIIFGAAAPFVPNPKDQVIVKYDNTAPIRLWGGDAFVGETIFAPIDREASANSEATVPLLSSSGPENQFQFGIGFPYRMFQMNPRVYQIVRTVPGAIPNVIQDRNWGYLAYLRQLCVMFCVESRVGVPFAHNNQSPSQSFPNMHYVMRPLRWDPDKSLADNNIYSEYSKDYGTDEMSLWKWGGFRFIQNINPDYSSQAPLEFVSKPKFGFVEKNDFPTRVMWSMPRQINSQDNPGLRTFPANNAFDIDDNQGEIKRAWSATTERGENLYALCDSGVCLLVTKKSILSDLNAGDLGYMAADTFIREQYWLSRDIGISDEMWRGAAEASVPVTLQNGAEVRKEAIFFPSKESVFRLMDNQILDIGRIKYHNTLYKKVLSNIKAGFQTPMAGYFDNYHQEYGLFTDVNDGEKTPDPSLIRMHIFGQKEGRWYGYYDYAFDQFVSISNKSFGLRDGQTYQLDKGYKINGQNITYHVWQAAAPEPFNDKEFIRVRINTKNEEKPYAVVFWDKFDGVPICALSQVTQGPLYLKMYRGWEQFIPSKDISISPTKDRVQGRCLIYSIIHNKPTDFVLIDTGIQYKILK